MKSVEHLLLPRGEGVRHYRHGYKKAGRYSTEYAIWSNIRARCNNPKNVSYERYGARGIKVCASWAADFLNFLADMGRRPSPSHSIDRIDNDGDYTPENCRWVTAKEQCRNRRSSRFIVYQGTRRTLAGWAEETGVSISTLHARLKANWPVERAMTEPVSARVRKGRGEAHEADIYLDPVRRLGGLK